MTVIDRRIDDGRSSPSGAPRRAGRPARPYGRDMQAVAYLIVRDRSAAARTSSPTASSRRSTTAARSGTNSARGRGCSGSPPTRRFDHRQRVGPDRRARVSMTSARSAEGPAHDDSMALWQAVKDLPPRMRARPSACATTWTCRSRRLPRSSRSAPTRSRPSCKSALAAPPYRARRRARRSSRRSDMREPRRRRARTPAPPGSDRAPRLRSPLDIDRRGPGERRPGPAAPGSAARDRGWFALGLAAALIVSRQLARGRCPAAAAEGRDRRGDHPFVDCPADLASPEHVECPADQAARIPGCVRPDGSARHGNQAVAYRPARRLGRVLGIGVIAGQSENNRSSGIRSRDASRRPVSRREAVAADRCAPAGRSRPHPRRLTSIPSAAAPRTRPPRSMTTRRGARSWQLDRWSARLRAISDPPGGWPGARARRDLGRRRVRGLTRCSPPPRSTIRRRTGSAPSNPMSNPPWVSEHGPA